MSPDTSKKRRLAYRVMLGILLLLWVVGAGCYTKNIEEAFNGEFSARENNRVISEYCQSCHLHRDFIPETHLADQVLAYQRKVFRLAEECRICHYLEKQFMLNDFTRKTRRPKDANRGKFRKFERETLKSQKARKTPKNRS